MEFLKKIVQENNQMQRNSTAREPRLTGVNKIVLHKQPHYVTYRHYYFNSEWMVKYRECKLLFHFFLILVNITWIFTWLLPPSQAMPSAEYLIQFCLNRFDENWLELRYSCFLIQLNGASPEKNIDLPLLLWLIRCPSDRKGLRQWILSPQTKQV